MKLAKFLVGALCLLLVVSAPFWTREESQANPDVPRSNVQGLWDTELTPLSRMSSTFTNCGGATFQFPLWYPATMDYVSIRFLGEWRVNTTYHQLGEWYAKKNGSIMAQGAIYPYNDREFHLVGNPTWIAEGNTVTGYLVPNALLASMDGAYPEFDVTWNSDALPASKARKVNLYGWSNITFVADFEAENLRAGSELIATTSGNAPCLATLQIFGQDGMSAQQQSVELVPGISSRFSVVDSATLLGSGMFGGMHCPTQVGTVYRVESLSQPNTGTTFPAEAGLGVAEPSTFHSISIRKTADGYDTAIAINNPTGALATFDLYLFDAERILQKRVQQTLSPMGSLSRFYHELLELNSPQLRQVPDEFEGTLVIVSDADLGVVSLVTKDGLPSASLPSMSF